MKKGVKIDPIRFGVAGGVFWGALVLLVTIFSSRFPTWAALFRECYSFIGYNTTTFFGGLLGLVYGFIDGFIALLAMAWIYNILER